ncbi:MAG: sugar phosphate nucleotidyltransferase [Candidatus Pacebacteria bacterium]|nr:sugar phosphate nucleotidyltransferase [Candidatus Paceibacterota bacterium]
MNKVKKAIFPIAGLATRFLPESKVVPKELIPLGSRPLLHYNVKEAILSGIDEISFITRQKQTGALEYFENNEYLEEVLKNNNKEKELKALNELKNLANNVKFSSFIQKRPTGDADAIFKARDFCMKEPCAISFCDDVVDSNVPCLEQLQEMFLTCGRPVLALKRVPPERIPSYGIVKVEKIANKFYKIKSVTQKPKVEDAPSDLAILGRMIITPDVFDYLSNNKDAMQKDRSITQALGEMAELGKAVYGYEIDGDWLECGDIISWYKSFIKMALKDEENGEKLRRFLKSLKL